MRQQTYCEEFMTQILLLLVTVIDNECYRPTAASCGFEAIY